MMQFMWLLVPLLLLSVAPTQTQGYNLTECIESFEDDFCQISLQTTLTFPINGANWNASVLDEVGDNVEDGVGSALLIDPESCAFMDVRAVGTIETRAQFQIITTKASNADRDAVLLDLTAVFKSGVLGVKLMAQPLITAEPTMMQISGQEPIYRHPQAPEKPKPKEDDLWWIILTIVVVVGVLVGVIGYLVVQRRRFNRKVHASTLPLTESGKSIISTGVLPHHDDQDTTIRTIVGTANGEATFGSTGATMASVNAVTMHGMGGSTVVTGSSSDPSNTRSSKSSGKHKQLAAITVSDNGSVKTDHTDDSLDVPNVGHVKRGEVLGEGAFGKVYLGHHMDTGESVAIKRMHLNADRDPDGSHRAMIHKEVDVMKTLRHPHIVRYIGWHDDDKTGVIEIFIEYVTNGNLLGMIRRMHGNVKEGLVHKVARQCLWGLEYLHEQNIIHRDIKPANIMLDQFGNVKLADFGSLFAGDASETTSTMQAETLTGTPAYMAPEAISSATVRKSDIWSLAATLSQMATGKLPWKHLNTGNSHQLLFKIAMSDGTPEYDRETFTPEYHSFMKALFTRNKDDRPSATEALKLEWMTVEPPMSPTSADAAMNSQLWASTDARVQQAVADAAVAAPVAATASLEAGGTDTDGTTVAMAATSEAEAAGADTDAVEKSDVDGDTAINAVRQV